MTINRLQAAEATDSISSKQQQKEQRKNRSVTSVMGIRSNYNVGILQKVMDLTVSLCAPCDPIGRATVTVGALYCFYNNK